MKSFPRTEVAGISLPRILIGSNWVLGYSHTSSSADKMIKNRYSTKEAVCELMEAYLEYDINAVMAPFQGCQAMLDGIKMAEDKTGKEIIIIDTPIIDVEDSAKARQAAEKVIAQSRKNGATFCMPHHVSTEQLVSKLHGTMERLPDYLDMIRNHGMIPGLSAHMPEVILYADQNEYDVQTYIQIFNPVGFLMQVEVEYISRVIWNAKKPVMTIKSMAAGRVTPYVGITFSFSALRPCDMVTVGAHTVDEVHEDVEVAFAALEHRLPDLEGRNSPVKTEILGGKG